jgi:hypothetical protein
MFGIGEQNTLNFPHPCTPVESLLHSWLTLSWTSATPRSTPVYHPDMQGLWKPLRIYPKNDQGQPRYNPQGKYAVKLNVMGKERLVTIDDRMPIFDEACLLPRTKDKAEIWPMLLCKALFKALSIPAPVPDQEQEEEDTNAPKRCFPNLSHRDVFTFFVTCLTGWQAEAVPIRQYDAMDVLTARLKMGHVFPCAWGNHPQERIKYISSFNDAASPNAQPEEAPEHW